MARRFGDAADIECLDASRDEVRSANAEIVQRIQDDGLVYPVTVIDGQPMYDGAVSYPAIIRSVEGRLAQARDA